MPLRLRFVNQSHVIATHVLNLVIRMFEVSISPTVSCGIMFEIHTDFQSLEANAFLHHLCKILGAHCKPMMHRLSTHSDVRSLTCPAPFKTKWLHELTRWARLLIPTTLEYPKRAPLCKYILRPQRVYLAFSRFLEAFTDTHIRVTSSKETWRSSGVSLLGFSKELGLSALYPRRLV